jgi:hypothetical protein
VHTSKPLRFAFCKNTAPCQNPGASCALQKIFSLLAFYSETLRIVRFLEKLRDLFKIFTHFSKPLRFCAFSKQLRA